MVAILLAGIIGYRFLPVSALPEVDYPTIRRYPLSPRQPGCGDSAITAPLERQFGQMSGLKQMSSQSSGGASVVTLQFQLAVTGRGRAGGAGCDQRRHQPAAVRPA